MLLTLFSINGFKYSELINSSFWPIEKTVTGTPTTDQSGPESNGNDGVLHIPQSYRSRVSGSEAFYISRTLLVFERGPA